MLEACAAYLRCHVLDALPAPVLRAALDLGLESLAAHMEADFLGVRRASTSLLAGVLYRGLWRGPVSQPPWGPSAAEGPTRPGAEPSGRPARARRSFTS